ncbi:TPA: hypothetical protein DCE37_04050 [Candidatus Latescibacteria bacterium]|nr:hypothetical protein [Candidatus Latescibacterota bacterium]
MIALLQLIVISLTVSAQDVPPWRAVGYYDHAPIRESSGLVASHQREGVYWTLNDSGNHDVIYATGLDGKLIREFRVIGDDDQVAVWINGTEVHRNNRRGGAFPDEDVVPCQLESGWNQVLCEVGQNGGGWALYVRFNDPDGSLKYAAQRR